MGVVVAWVVRSAKKSVEKVVAGVVGLAAVLRVVVVGVCLYISFAVLVVCGVAFLVVLVVVAVVVQRVVVVVVGVQGVGVAVVVFLLVVVVVPCGVEFVGVLGGLGWCGARGGVAASIVLHLCPLIALVGLLFAVVVVVVSALPPLML